MFIDLATATPAEREALAEALPGPHVWEYIPASVCGIDEAFGCQACFAAFSWDETIPERPCVSGGLPGGGDVQVHLRGV
jgi:hypothetical protein